MPTALLAVFLFWLSSEVWMQMTQACAAGFMLMSSWNSAADLSHSNGCKISLFTCQAGSHKLR
jgi:hypothetical protein